MHSEQPSVCLQVISVWADILKAVPQSRLVLKNKPFACDALKAHWLLQLRQHGISSDRIDLLPLNPSNSGMFDF